MPSDLSLRLFSFIKHTHYHGLYHTLWGGNLSLWKAKPTSSMSSHHTFPAPDLWLHIGLSKNQISQSKLTAVDIYCFHLPCICFPWRTTTSCTRTVDQSVLPRPNGREHDQGFTSWQCPIFLFMVMRPTSKHLPWVWFGTWIWEESNKGSLLLGSWTVRLVYPSSLASWKIQREGQGTQREAKPRQGKR